MDPAALALTGGQPVRSSPFPSWPRLGPGDMERIHEVLAGTNWGGQNAGVAAFETIFAEYHDARFGVAVASGTLALELALLAADIKTGDEVIVPAHSFVATASAVSRTGATPVFADIDADSFNLDSMSAEEALSDRTKAIIPVHFGGVVAEMDRLASLAQDHGLRIIEDAAHAHGAEWFGTRAGGIGDIGVFSFQNSKAMAAGEGGILVTSDEHVAGKARSIADAGRVPDRGWFDHVNLGSNLRMAATQAALLMGQLERLSDQIRVRGKNFSHFEAELGSVPGLHLQRAPEGATAQTRYVIPGRIDAREFGCDRDAFVEAMQAEGIPVRPFYPHPLYRNAAFEDKPHRALRCPVAERASLDSFWLPMRLFMGAAEDAADVSRAITKLHEAFRHEAVSRQAL